MMETFFQIRKVDEEKRLVYGRATQEVLDRSGEVMDYASSKPLIEAWSAETFDASGGLSKGNIRSMHRNDSAAGKVEDIEFDDDAKAVDLVVKVVDDAEWAKVTEGVYTGFSMGGKYVKKWADPSITTSAGKAAVRYTAQPSEISLVDRPCVPTAGFFEIRKTDGTTEQRAFHQGEAPMADETKAVESAELIKGLWEGQRFLSFLSDGHWLQRAIADEKTREGDASTVPEDLKAAIALIAELAERYVGEQLAELKAGGAVADASEAAGEVMEASAKADAPEVAEDPEAVEKAARNGRKQLRSDLGEAIEKCNALHKAYLDTYKGACDESKDDEGGDMAAADKADHAEDLAKADAPDIEEMVRRAVADAVRPFQEALTKSAPTAPAVRAPSLRALDKSEESPLVKAGDGLDDLRKAAEGDSPEAVRSSIKLAMITNATTHQ